MAKKKAVKKQVKKTVAKVAKKKPGRKPKPFQFKITKNLKVAEKLINKFHQQMEKLGVSVILFAGAKDDSILSVRWASDNQILCLLKHLEEMIMDQPKEDSQPSPELKL